MLKCECVCGGGGMKRASMGKTTQVLARAPLPPLRTHSIKCQSLNPLGKLGTITELQTWRAHAHFPARSAAYGVANVQKNVSSHLIFFMKSVCVWVVYGVNRTLLIEICPYPP